LLSGEELFEDFHFTGPVTSREFSAADTIFSLASAGLLSMIMPRWFAFRQVHSVRILQKPSSSMTESAPADYIIREACVEDIEQLEEFVNRFVQANRLLPRTARELQDLIPFGFVAVSEGRIVGFAALEIYSAKLAEVRSLAVDQDFQGRGIGRGLVQRCVDLAVKRNVLEVMAITSSDRFFQACGFDFTLPGEKKALFIQTREHF
jgi:amino-acid N-acetyltransferase